MIFISATARITLRLRVNNLLWWESTRSPIQRAINAEIVFISWRLRQAIFKISIAIGTVSYNHTLLLLKRWQHHLHLSICSSRLPLLSSSHVWSVILTPSQYIPYLPKLECHSEINNKRPTRGLIYYTDMFYEVIRSYKLLIQPSWYRD